MLTSNRTLGNFNTGSNNPNSSNAPQTVIVASFVPSEPDAIDLGSEAAPFRTTYAEALVLEPANGAGSISSSSPIEVIAPTVSVYGGSGVGFEVDTTGDLIPTGNNSLGISSAQWLNVWTTNLTVSSGLKLPGLASGLLSVGNGGSLSTRALVDSDLSSSAGIQISKLNTPSTISASPNTLALRDSIGGLTVNALNAATLVITNAVSLTSATLSGNLNASAAILTGAVTAANLVLNGGSHHLTLQSASLSADTIVTIPDPGVATTSLILTDNPQLQNINSGLHLKSTLSVDGVSSLNGVTGTTAGFTGALTALSASITNAINAVTATFTGAVSTGALTASSVNTGSVVSTGAISGTSGTFTGPLSTTGSFNPSGLITGTAAFGGNVLLEENLEFQNGGTGPLTTVTVPTPGANRNLTIPDAGMDTNVILSMSTGGQSIGGGLTSTGPLSASGGFSGTTGMFTGSVGTGALSSTTGTFSGVLSALTAIFGSTTYTGSLSFQTGGSGTMTTVSVTQPSANRTVTIPDPGANANVILSAGGTQTINSALTVTGLLTSTTLTATSANIGGASAVNINTLNSTVGNYLPLTGGTVGSLTVSALSSLASLTVTGITTLTGALNAAVGTFTGLLTASGGLSVTGSTTLNGNLTLAGSNPYINSNANTATIALGTNSQLTATGIPGTNNVSYAGVALQSTANSGTVTNSPLVINTSGSPLVLSSTPATSVSTSAYQAASALYAVGTSIFTGWVTMLGNLSVSGNTTVGGTLNGNTFPSPAGQLVAADTGGNMTINGTGSHGQLTINGSANGATQSGLAYSVGGTPKSQAGWSSTIGCFIYDNVNTSYLLYQNGQTKGYLRTPNVIIDDGGGNGIYLSTATTTNYDNLGVFCTNLTAGQGVTFNLGVDGAGNNSAQTIFNYVGPASTSNNVSLGFANVRNAINYNAAGLVTTFKNQQDDGTGNTITAGNATIKGHIIDFAGNSIALPPAGGTLATTAQLGNYLPICYMTAMMDSTGNVYTLGSVGGFAISGKTITFPSSYTGMTVHFFKMTISGLLQAAASTFASLGFVGAAGCSVTGMNSISYNNTETASVSNQMCLTACSYVNISSGTTQPSLTFGATGINAGTNVTVTIEIMS